MKLFLLQLIILTGILSCKKSNEPGSTYHRLNPAGLDYVQLTQGKYFIYKDSASGDIDSVVVTNSTLSKVFVPAWRDTMTNLFKSPDMYVDTFGLTLRKIISSGSEDWLVARASAWNVSPISRIVDVHLLSNVPNNNATVFAMQSCSFCGDSTFAFKDIEGKRYNDVISTGTNGSTLYYWAKGVGIIKRRIVSGTSTKTALLIRYG